MSQYTHEEMQNLILAALFNAANSDVGPVTVERIATSMNLPRPRVALAVEALETRGYLSSSYDDLYDVAYQISEFGYLHVEKTRPSQPPKKQQDAVSSASDDEQSSEITNIEQGLAPAAGRMVSFGDNQEAFDQAVAAVEQAEGAIGASNLMSEEQRLDTLLSLRMGKELITKSKNFAIGAFKYLVMDRIKEAFKGAIEDAFKYVLIASFMTLGYILLGFL